MLIGLLGDSHADPENAFPYVIEALRKLGVGAFIHTGDIDPKHFTAEAFLGLPTICVLIEDQIGPGSNPIFARPPHNIITTVPDDRIRDFCGLKLYAGHKRSWQYLAGSEQDLMALINKMRKDYDGLSLMLSGHTHHEIFLQGDQVSFINPGAIWNSFDGHEYATFDTISSRVTFGRIPKAKPLDERFQVGVMSDSFNVSRLRPNFWEKLAKAFKIHKVKNVIHCGNISLLDIGKPELNEFTVHFNLRGDQVCPEELPANWKLIDHDVPVVEVEGYKFLVKLDFSLEIAKHTEVDLNILSEELLRKFPEISFILCGFTRRAFLEEGPLIKVVNPGDALKDNNFVVIRLPTTEIIFDNIPADPLPPIEQ